MIYTTYGEGGYDPEKPNNNIIDQYDDGVEANDASMAIPASAVEELAAKLEDPSVGSIAALKSALKSFLNHIS